MTDADRIARLEEENAHLREQVAYLRSELGDMVTANEARALRRAIYMEPKQALILLRLYHARGRVVTHFQLAETLGPDGTYNAVKVHLSRLRKLFGVDLVENVYGRGYALTARGLEMIGAALEQPHARAA